MADPDGALFPHRHGDQPTLPDEPDPLDVPQDFEQATSYEVRGELEDLIRRDLLGPWDGEDEKFAPRAMGPRERYLVGMLGPKHVRRSRRPTSCPTPSPGCTATVRPSCQRWSRRRTSGGSGVVDGVVVRRSRR